MVNCFADLWVCMSVCVLAWSCVMLWYTIVEYMPAMVEFSVGLGQLPEDFLFIHALYRLVCVVQYENHVHLDVDIMVQ